MRKYAPLVVGIFFIVSCRTAGILDASAPATVYSLNEELKVTAHLGRLPIPVEDDAPIERYALQPNGSSTEYLMVVSPHRVRGKITIPFSTSHTTSDSAVAYHGYLDQLLRIHRSILRGDLKEALVFLDQIDERYEPSYGSLVLRGDISYLMGEGAESQRFFDLAKRIFPDTKAWEAVKK